MKKSLGAKTMSMPEPVFLIATYDENGTPDIMNAAWVGQVSPEHISMSLSNHTTTRNLDLNKEFTVSFATKDYVIAADWVGIVSLDKDPDKIKKSGFTFTKSETVNAPVINELPVALECRLVAAQEEFGETRYVGEVVNVLADESVLNEKGGIDSGKAQFIGFDPAGLCYRVFGEVAASAFGSGKALDK